MMKQNRSKKCWSGMVLYCMLVVTIFAAPVKVACVGDSITFGAGVAAREKLNYPRQLGYLLGAGYEVRNFGRSGATMLSKGNLPYMKQVQYRKSLEFQPDIVILKLGTNDSKPQNWKHKGEFAADAMALVKTYQALPSKPRVILCKPVVVAKDRWGITEKVVKREVSSAIAKVAQDLGVEMIDLRPILLNHKDWVPDGVHPNAFGAEAIARHLYRYLTTARETTPKISYPKATKSSWFHGFEMLDFKLDGVACKIVKPRRVAKGAPWVWRARFWGHQPQFDVAMLELGWHVVYCDVANLFGAPDAVKRWDRFYQETQRIGLHAKVVLEGMSRGGLIIHNWAVANPAKVAGLIADNAVMDITSWPGGLGTGKGSEKDWNRCKQVYGLADDAAARAYDKNPVDTVKQLAEAKVPLLYLVGTADKVVPADENSFFARDQLAGYPGLQVIEKPGKGHHPHALENPAPIVDFALKAHGLYRNPAAMASPSAEFRGSSAGWGGGIWWDQHENINRIAKANPDLELIFLGDSISQSWTGPRKRVSDPSGGRTFDKQFGKHWKSASFGISGDRTEHLIFRVQHGNVDGIKPKVVVVMIGVNNINHGHSATQISGGIKQLVASLKQKLPQSRILLLGPLPTAWKSDSPQRLTCDQIHKQIASLGKEPQVRYLNLSEKFLEPDGALKKSAYRGDGIHLSGGGYELWASLLVPELKAMTSARD
ncbi:prolyl oligopeptidase family serine peptidase [Verrucomicrobiaceae bacterium N1E253]|uniref:Prolyl oligopeptidase family serine peptidase n=1 Tax=Oceaniferula marina TaxID=2748318 RepID=A0A851GHR1_9BACT|nr:GDSL-type esterase/lipase family protein [Oceaniferula marina]NWK55401.1 prolyl oligopeptidase family serine peptidase [Oceaniferula marina]